MATSASAPQQLDASASTSSYNSSVPEYYASYPQASDPLIVQLCLRLSASDLVMLVHESLAKRSADSTFISAS